MYNCAVRQTDLRGGDDFFFCLFLLLIVDVQIGPSQREHIDGMVASVAGNELEE